MSRRPFGGERAGHAQQARLGRAVGHGRRHADARGERADVDDRARGHAPRGRLGAEEGALEVGVDDPVPERLVDLERGATCSMPALLIRMSSPPSAGDGAVDRRLDLAGLAHVERERHGLAAGGLDRCCRQSSSAATSRAQIATSAPKRARPAASAAPMPRLAPVTSALRPAREKSGTDGSGMAMPSWPLMIARRLEHDRRPDASPDAGTS